MSTINARHSHGMSMTGMSMGAGAGTPTLFQMQSYFWAFIASTIGVFTLVNIINKIICFRRITSAKFSRTPAKPKSIFFKSQASISAILREYSNYSISSSIRGKQVYLPTAGPFTLLIAYLCLIVACCLYALNPKDLLEWEDLGYRTGFIAVSQVCLIILLAGKRNILGFITGMGYERLAAWHRWTARSLLFTILLHVFFWFEEWIKYDYVSTKLKQDPLTQKGLVAGGILLWIVVSSAAPIRGLSYEIFLAQHVISWIAFVTALWMHIPDENRNWLVVSLAIFGFDRVVRLLYVMYNNLSIFHNRKSSLLACKATFIPLNESHTRISIAHPPISWTPGQHVFLSVPVLAPFTSHPFTIASLPTDNTMEFIVRAKKGATKSFFKYADKISPSALPSFSSTASIAEEKIQTKTVLIDGPYSRIRPLQQFDSVLFIAGSTGATFTVPLLRDLVQTWSKSYSTRTTSPSLPSLRSKLTLQPPLNEAVTRRIRFIWVLKNSDWISWFSAQLENTLSTVDDLRNKGMDIDLSISIYVTSSHPRPSLTPVPDAIPSDRENADRMLSSRDEKSSTQTFPSSTPSTATKVFSFGKAYNDAVASYSTPGFHDPKIISFAGRPDLEFIINEEAEMARGEMGVVVCGPTSMVREVRNVSCGVSDRRGVHKGTGAQGIWVHGEGFGYA